MEELTWNQLLGWKECKAKSRYLSNPPSLYGQQVHRLASAATPVRAPGAMPIFLRCSERREQGSIWQLRGRQVYTGSSCYCVSLGTPFTYSTAPLLTSCPHTESHHQAHVFPCLHSWNLFLPSGLSETHWKHSRGRDLCHTSALLFLTSFHQLLFSPHLPLSLKLRALPSSYMSIHIFSTLPQLHSTDSGSWLFILPSCICFHVAQSTQASSVTIIVCSCSNLSPELILA